MTVKEVDGLLCASEFKDYQDVELPPRIPEEDIIASRGACAGTQHVGFLDLSRNKSKERAEAKRLCARCPVQAECRTVADYLDAHVEEYDLMVGVWAGEGPAARERRRKDAAYEAA